MPTGDPDGLRIVEKSNWPGVGVVFNRTNYKEVVGREEFDKTGVYVLVGTSEGSLLPTIYVGEGDPVKGRLNQHYGKIDFWDWAVFFVAKDVILIPDARMASMASRSSRSNSDRRVIFQSRLPDGCGRAAVRDERAVAMFRDQ